MGYTDKDVGHALPLDAHKQKVTLEGYTQAPEMRKQLDHKATAGMLKKGSRATRSRWSKKQPRPATTPMDCFNVKLRDRACPKPATSASPHRGGLPARRSASKTAAHAQERPASTATSSTAA